MPEPEHGDRPALRRRLGTRVASTHFAGRIGGNQEFIADTSDEDHQTLLEQQPDAAPIATFASSLDLKGFLTPDLWRLAFIEGWGTFLLVCMLGAVASGLTATDQTLFAQNLYGALASFVGLTLFTFGLAPITGGHLNPVISLSTFFAGLSTLPRAALYICAQSIGGIVAGFWLRLSLGDAYFSKGVIPGCTVNPNEVSVGQYFALEYMFTQAMIFIAFGVGLDPRQSRAIGPTLAPVLVGLVLGLGNLCSGIARSGYSGVSFNPARCLGLMVAKQELRYHYVHWLAPLVAATLNGLFYHIAPPWKREQPLLRAILHRRR